MLNAEVPYYEHGFDTRYVSIQQMFFKPPAPGNKRYRFWTSQDNLCYIYIYDQNPNEIAPNRAAMTPAIVSHASHTSFR